MAQANDYAADLQWAWEHLADVELKRESAPSSAAYFLWSWGRESPDKFVPMAARVMSKKDEDRDVALRDDGRRQMELLELFKHE